MDDGNIAPQNPGKQAPDKRNERTPAPAIHNPDARRPTYMLETGNPTREKETSHSHLWRIITQATQETRHTRSGHDHIREHTIRARRQAPQ